MRHLARIAAAALTVCLVPGLAAPGAAAPPGLTVAEPSVGTAEPSVGTAPELDAAEPSVDPAAVAARLMPQPREVSLTGERVRVRPVATLMADAGVDPRVVDEAEAVLADLGVRVVRRSTVDSRRTTSVFTLYLSDAPSSDVTARLARLRVAGPDGLPPGGYVLATGARRARDVVVVAGADAAGAFHGLQTLRQLAEPGRHRTHLAAGTVRDWPEHRLRGVIEGFYGEPWSQADRLATVELLGDLKGNSYVYAPKDDPFHLARWRDPYPADRLAELDELVDRAAANLVQLVFTVSPGQDICYSDPADRAALLAKLDAMWDLGVRQFGVFFDDIDLELDCPADVEAYGASASPSAAAQADLLTAVHEQLVDARPGAAPLLTVPVEYSGTSPSDYQAVFAAGVPDDVVVYWTGPEVVSDTITAHTAAEVVALWDHPVAIWDNYPVNDFAPARLFMGPLIGRDAELDDVGVVGLSANPMNQARASGVPLATVLDFLWHPDAYDPDASWTRALAYVGGDAADALRTVAENSLGSDIGHPRNPVLEALFAAFADVIRQAPLQGHDEALIAYFERMAAVRTALEAHADPALVAELGPWIDKVVALGRAGAAGARSLVAQDHGDWTEAWQQRQAMERAAADAAAIDVEVSGGLMDRILEFVRDRSDLVVLTVDADDGTLEPGGELVLTAAVSSGDVPIASVAFLAGPDRLAVDTTAPFTVRFADVPEGLYSLYAVATDAVGTEVASGIVRTVVGDPAPVLLVVAPDPNPADAAGDDATAARIEFLGYPVRTVTAPEVTAADTDGTAAVVVTESVSSGDVNTKLRDVAVPVAVWEHFLYDDMGMAADPNLAFRTASVDVVAPASPLAAGSSGTVAILEREGVTGYGTPTADAEVVAVVPGLPQQATVFAYEPGDALIGLTAPARRLGLPYVDDAVDVLTPAGQAMFDAAVTWLVEGVA